MKCPQIVDDIHRKCTYLFPKTVHIRLLRVVLGVLKLWFGVMLVAFGVPSDLMEIRNFAVNH